MKPVYNFIVRRGETNQIIVFLCWYVRGKMKVLDFVFNDALILGAYHPESFCLAFMGSQIEGQILPDFPDKKAREELIEKITQGVLREINDLRR